LRWFRRQLFERDWERGREHYEHSAGFEYAERQRAQCTVATCESRADVVRYSWFTGRMNNDVHFTSLLGTAGQLTDLGKLYISLPYTK